MNSKVGDEQNTIVSHVWLHCCGSTIAANPSNKIISNMQLLHLQYNYLYSTFIITLILLLENYIQKNSILTKKYIHIF